MRQRQQQTERQEQGGSLPLCRERQAHAGVRVPPGHRARKPLLRGETAQGLGGDARIAVDPARIAAEPAVGLPGARGEAGDDVKWVEPEPGGQRRQMRQHWQQGENQQRASIGHPAAYRVKAARLAPPHRRAQRALQLTSANKERLTKVFASFFKKKYFFLFFFEKKKPKNFC
ncbi:MAG: hypothetical protein WDN04_07625 [Rhodospirillales bacterium]